MKRILILSPTTFGYETRTADAVAALGHSVLRMDERIGNDFWSKAMTRLGLVRLLRGRLRRHLDAVMANALVWRADMLLIVNPETLRGGDYRRLREALPGVEIVIYMWDSQRQKPLPDAAFGVADAVYSFDPVDCARDPRLRHLPLFHDNPAPPSPGGRPEADLDFVFVGSAHMRRLRLLSRIGRVLRSQGREHVFFLKAQGLPQLVFYRVAALILGYRGRISATALDYAAYLHLVRRAACVIDIEFARQSGLTMRSMEVAFSGTRLLTTNPAIRRYDFYDPDRIVALDPRRIELPVFDRPAPPPPRALFEKYAIGTWAATLVEKRQGQYLRPDFVANARRRARDPEARVSEGVSWTADLSS